MADNAGKLLHNVFFTLEDSSPAKQEHLVDECYTYLSDAPGAVTFSAGRRRTGNTREVNDLGFHVALTILFETAEAQDAYQEWGPHEEFISRNNGNWKEVRVFDSDVR